MPHSFDELIRVWARYERWAEKNYPELLESFSPGVSDEELNAFERELGRELSFEFKFSYMVHDGQEAGPTGLLFGYRLLPLDQIRAGWEGLLFMDLENDGSRDLYKSVPRGAIKDLGCSKYWIPFSGGDGVDWSIALDLDPASAGNLGQIINVGLREFEKYQLAKNFYLLLDNVVTLLEQHEFEIDGVGNLNLPNRQKPHHDLDFVDYFSSQASKVETEI